MTQPLPPLNGLRAFEAAARHGSFTRAADELHVTQTAISHQIRKLEEELGVRLFVRTPGAVHLTQSAEAYLTAVHDAFDHLRAATAKLLGTDGRRALRVSTTPSFASTWLVPRLAGFQAEHPEIDVEVSTSMALVDFRREEVDMAIRYGRGSWPGLRATWLLSDDIFPVCTPTLAARLRTPSDLAGQRLIAISTYRDMWHRWLTAAGQPSELADHATVFDMPILAIQAAPGGMGVALVQGPLVEAELASGRLVVPFGLQLPSEMGFYIVAPEPNADRPEIALLRAWLLDHARA